MSNVIQHQTAIWAELKQWCDREQTHAAQARACWPEIASRMARLRKDYPSNDEFGVALVIHGIEYNVHDRAAFIWMGQLGSHVLEDAMARCQRRSPRTFRQEVESWRDDYFAPSLQECKDADSPLTSPPAATPVMPETAQSATAPICEERESQPQDHAPGALDKRMTLVQKLPERDARQLLDHYTNPDTRRMLAKLPKALLSELVTLVASGRLGAVNDSQMIKFSARVLVPELSSEWTRQRIFEPTDTKRVKAILADAERFIAMREAGCRTKAQCDEWWNEHVTQRKAVDVTVAKASPPTTSGNPDATPIIVHGRTIWPRPAFVSDPERYPRSMARACFFLWQDLDRRLAVQEPDHVSRAVIIARLAPWIRDGISEPAGRMLHEMALAQKSDAAGTAETSRLSFVNGDKL